jgi:hypothetical protein
MGISADLISEIASTACGLFHDLLRQINEEVERQGARRASQDSEQHEPHVSPARRRAADLAISACGLQRYRWRTALGMFDVKH